MCLFSLFLSSDIFLLQKRRKIGQFMLTCHKRVFSFLWQMDPIACMVMSRPTYISGPARNGSIPPITMTDRSGQEYTHNVLRGATFQNHSGEKLKIITPPIIPMA